jgi:uncharacterized protein
MKNALLLGIRIYKRWLSPVLAKGIRCRFHPTCSEYAKLAIQSYGVRSGLLKTWVRLKKCRPDNFDSCMDYP